MRTRVRNLNVWLTLFMLIGMLTGSGGLKAEETWTYDPESKILSNGSSTLNNVTAVDNKLTIGYNSGFKETTLDLSAKVNDGYEIVIIKDQAFNNCSSLKSITLPSTITHIESNAFYGCSNLNSINIPTSVTEIGNAAFGKTGFISIDLSQNLITKINSSTFTRCSKLTKITLPASVNNIGSSAFTNCSALTKIICLSSTQPNIANGAFDNVESRIVYAPNGTQDSWDASKWGASEIVYDYPPSLWIYDIEKSTLSKNNITLKVGETDKKLTINDNTSFNETVLDLSGEIENDYMVVAIAADALKNNTNLTTLTLPTTVATIGNNAFDGCSALATINYLGENEPTIGTSAFANGPADGRKVFASAATDASNWNSENQWGTNSVVIGKFNWIFKGGELSNPDGLIKLTTNLSGDEITITGSNTLSDEANLDLSGYYGDDDKKIYSVVAIAANAFADKKLGEVTLPASITSIGSNAFKGATITTLHMLGNTPPATVGTDAFKVTNLQSFIVRVPNGKLSAYHVENNEDTYTNWGNLPYILEESGVMYNTITWSYGTTDMTDTDITYPNFKVAMVPVGQLFKFAIKATNTTYGIKVEAYDGETPITKGFSYKDGIVSIKLDEAPESNLTFKVYLVKPIVEDGSNDITIKSDEEYNNGSEDKPYNGQIGNGTSETEIKSLKVDASESLTVLLNQVKVETASGGASSTTITAGTEVTFSLIGTNDLGTVENNGTLILEASDNTAALNTTNTVVTNKGVFTDYTGQLTAVSGDADLTVSNTSKSEEKVKEGNFIVLTAEGASQAGTAVTYGWEKKDGAVWKNVKGITKSIGDGSAENELKVLSSAAGQYRCQITATNSVSNVVTTLTHYTTVTEEKTPDPTPTPDPDPIYYQITLPAIVGAITNPGAGVHEIEEGYSFSFTLTLETDYNQSTPVVKANNKEIIPDANGKYKLGSTYSNVKIEITGVVKNAATGIDDIDVDAPRVWAANGMLHINVPQPEKVRIITFSGTLYKDLGTLTGKTVIPMPKGSYIVIAGETATKIIL